MDIRFHADGAAVRRLSAAALAVLACGLAAAQVPFAKPEDAGQALIDAVAKSDAISMPRLLGPDWRKLLPTEGVPPAERQAFIDKAREKHEVVVDGGRAELVVGNDRWPLPIPIVQGKDGQWRFDPAGGREAVLERQIGANELSAMQAVLAYVDAQREYAQADRNGDGVLEYAQKFLSTPGKRDGLIWSPSLGDESPLGEAYLPRKAGTGYHGYRYRILTAQGSHAIGGARSYLLGGRLASGFALVAWPVQYGRTGIMSFIVNQDGVVYECNLGSNTSIAATRMKSFDPGDGWKRVQP